MDPLSFRFFRLGALAALSLCSALARAECVLGPGGMYMDGGKMCTPAAAPENPPATPSLDTGENGKATPAQVRRILLNLRSEINAKLPESVRLLKPDFDELLKASLDPKNIDGITPDFYVNLKRVMTLDVQREMLQERARQSGLNEEQKQTLANLNEQYARGEEMSKIMTVGLGHVYMTVDQDNGHFGDLPPDDQRGHNADWAAKPGAGAAPWNFSGQTELNLGNPSGAKTAFDHALSLDPRNADALVGRGTASEKLGDYAAAYRDAKAALEIDPGNRKALALEKFTEGRGAPSGGEASQAAAGAGGFPGAPSRGGPGAVTPEMKAAASRLSAEQAQKAAANALSLNDLPGALGYVDRALALDPGNAALLNMRASIHARLREYAKAAADAAAGLALLPGNAALLRTKAYAELRGRDYKGALASAGALLALDPRDAYAYALRAHAYGSLGDRDAMLADLRRAAELDPRFASAAAQAGTLQLPSDKDVLFLFPGEAASTASAAARAPGGRGRAFGLLVGVSALGGLLLALGLLRTVLAPLKAQMSSVFTRLTRTGPSVASMDESSPAPAASLPGLIRGQYEVSRQIGQGGMGTVYEGTDRSLGRRVAIKKMRDEIRNDPRERARFVAEAKTVAALHHPNVVDIYAIVEDAGDVFLVFEYVDGRTVHDVVQSSGRLEPKLAAGIARAAAEALGYAHSRGVIHRDMKPSNVMLDASGRVKVMDFGIARAAKDAMTRCSMTNTVAGTPPYMAPEQEQGQVRKESDVYALGICAYEMLTGKLPFVGIGAGMLMNKINMSYIAPSRAIAGLPDALDAVFQKAFQADPEKRYRTPAEFADALESALPGAVRA